MTSWDGRAYQARFDELAGSGADVHGEAGLVAGLGPASVLDAGCGSGRVAAELARRGVDVVGVDADRSMIAAAQARWPDLRWVLADVATLDLGRHFDVVVMAGNVPLFAAPGSQGALVEGCARHLGEAGRLVSGFQLGRGYGLEAYDAHCAAVGLQLVRRWATWDRAEFPGDGSYAVSVHAPLASPTL